MESSSRDGLAELSPGDQRNMTRRASIFHGVKIAAEFGGRRPTRFKHVTGTDQGSHEQKSSGNASKLVYFVRHGEGLHNVWRAREQAAGRTPTAKRHNIGAYPEELHDPLLTAKGHADAVQAAEVARRLPRPDLLVTSPLRRAVQTMSVVFSDALEAGAAPAVAHELCREQFHGADPSIYDSRLSRDRLAAAFPRVDFLSHVLPSSLDASGGGSIDDPLWWHCTSPFGDGGGAHGINEAAIVEHAYRFVEWLMARPEPVVAVATHCNFLLALYHGVLDGTPADAPPQVFHTGELRAVRIFAEEAPRAPRVCEFQSHAMFGATWSSQPPPSKATAESPCYVHCTIDPLSRGHAVGGADAPTSTLPLGCELEVAMEATPLTRERM